MQSVKDILDKLGRRTVESRLGVSSSAISNALGANKFPANWYVGLQQIAKKHGRKIPDRLFNMKGGGS